VEVAGAVNVVEGNMFACSECLEVIVGRGIAEELNAGVGSRLTLSVGNSSREVVVGVFETGIRFQEMVSLSGYVTQVLVKCADSDYVDSVVSTIRETFQGLAVVAQRVTVSLVEQTANTMKVFFSIGLVALSAGGFGIMNTTIMSVVERTRDRDTRVHRSWGQVHLLPIHS
jgi:ABC-type lipoprotein release transport system permease subunit